MTGPAESDPAGSHPTERWVAFISDETGDYQVHVTAFAGPGATVAVSTKGGLSPIWSADGQEPFFHLATKRLAARLSSGPTLDLGAVKHFDGPYTLDLIGLSARTSRPMGGGS